MIIIRGNTKKGDSLIQKASRNLGTELWHVYGSFSSAKREAMEDCKRMCAEENGTNFRIISKSINQFSVAWDVEQGVRIETAKNSCFVVFECI